MASERDRRRCAEQVTRLASAESGDFRQEAVELMRATLGFSRWCWPVCDPESLLGHSGHAQVDYWRSLPRMIVLDQLGMPSSRVSLARAQRPAISLHAATRGDFARDPRWAECQRPYGMGDELAVACRDEHGCWGSLQMHRDNDERPFSHEDVELAAQLAPVLGGAMRRSVARERLAATATPPPPGVLLIDEDLGASAWTPSAGDWLRQLPGADRYEAGGILPTAVYSAASRAFGGSRRPARVRVRTIHGRWATLDGAPLGGGGGDRVAVTIRASTSAEVLDLLSRACALTRRETQLVALLVTGLSTRELAEQLIISPYTVKDHLKAVFAKVGVRSRRELVAEILGTASTEAVEPEPAAAGA